MDKQCADDIVGMLPQGRSCFDYYPERYAWLLLRHVVGQGTAIATVKQSRFAGLLQKPRVKQWLAMLGSKRVSAAEVLAADGDGDPLHFTLSLDRWEGAQKTRSGVNLVLQLNFDRQHDALYQRLVKPKSQFSPFQMSGHPVNQQGRNTLAWSRIDVDLDAGEVLIEEIQNDWLRLVLDMQQNPRYRRRQIEGTEEDLQTYVRIVLARYQKVWAEAMLAATVQFVREELGICRLFYHSPASSQYFKGLRYSQPPRSIYTDLPRQFCFQSSKETPRFLAKKRAKIAANWPFYQLNLEALQP